MSKSNVQYADFKIERQFQAPISKVFKMFADQQTKELWFKGPNDADTEHTMDFRVGGQEYNRGKFHDGVVHEYRATYYDIIPDNRIIYTYEMYLDNKRISVSVATIEFKEAEGLTKLSLHESGVFLDGLDKPESRKYGSNLLMKALENAINNN